jgi:hypothetical protein
MGGQGLTMAGFHVEPEAVVGLGKLVGRAGEDAQSYLERALPQREDLLGQIGTELKEGILLNIWPALDRLQELGRRGTEKGAVLGTMGGDGLEQAAKHYRETDFFQAGRLDAAYGFGSSYTRLPEQGRVRDTEKLFTDRVPVGEYRPGNRSDDRLEQDLLYHEEELLAEIDKVTGLSSLYGQYRALIKDIIGYDPIEEAIRLVTGDWRTVFREAHGFAAAGGAFEKIQQNIDQGRFEIQDRWMGIAASRALAWLEDYSKACDQHAQFMRDAAQEIKLFARGMYHQLVALNSALDTVVDAVITAALTLAGVGPEAVPILGGLIAWGRGEDPAAVLASVLLAVKGVTEVIGNISTVVHGFIGVVETICGGTGERALASWPAQPYDHPSCG